MAREGTGVLLVEASILVECLMHLPTKIKVIGSDRRRDGFVSLLLSSPLWQGHRMIDMGVTEAGLARCVNVTPAEEIEPA